MYFVLYDRFLKSIGETYILESWSRVQRAVDFDDLKITGEQIPYSANPFLVVINDRQGKLVFSGLASTPVIDEKSKKTSISLKDYATLFNTEILVDWSKFSGSTVGQYIQFVFNLWLAQTDVGFSSIQCDVSDLSSVSMDSSISLGNGVESVSVHDLIFDALNYYNLYYTANLDIRNKVLTFRFLRCSTLHSVSLRLSDFDVNTIEKSFGEYNRATVYDHTHAIYSQWALTENNSVVKLPVEEDLVYPAKNRNFISDYKAPDEVKDAAKEEQEKQNALYDALYDAVMGLAENRYQESIDLNVQKYRSILDLSTIDFSYFADVYFEDGSHKMIPVGEIETDSKGKHIVRLGHRIQELTQEL